jgi:hypothetical protein
MTSEKKSFLLVQLQEAIDEAVTESSRVREIMEEMKRAGLELCLMLESTVSISPTEDQPDALPEPRLASNPATGNGELKLTAQDLEFLRDLQIAI